jgi:hypothetical protein
MAQRALVPAPGDWRRGDAITRNAGVTASESHRFLAKVPAPRRRVLHFGKCACERNGNSYLHGHRRVSASRRQTKPLATCTFIRGSRRRSARLAGRCACARFWRRGSAPRTGARRGNRDREPDPREVFSGRHLFHHPERADGLPRCGRDLSHPRAARLANQPDARRPDDHGEVHRSSLSRMTTVRQLRPSGLSRHRDHL